VGFAKENDITGRREMPEKVNKEFHKWLRDTEDWVKGVAQSDVVYQAMMLAYEAGKDSQKKTAESEE